MTWRDVPGEWRMKLHMKWADALSERLNYGLMVHGPKVHGNPIQHLQEELLDSIFYLEAIQNIQDSLCPKCKKKIDIDA